MSCGYIWHVITRYLYVCTYVRGQIEHREDLVRIMFLNYNVSVVGTFYFFIVLFPLTQVRQIRYIGRSRRCIFLF